MAPFRFVAQPGIPISDQVLFAAKKAILSGKLRPGDAFPSVRALGRAMKIHANTAQKVVAQLAAEGLIEIQPGVGAKIAEPPGPRNGRGRLLAGEMERLAVEAMQVGMTLEELQSYLAETWRRLNGKEGA